MRFHVRLGRNLARNVKPRFGDTLKDVPCIGGLLGMIADFVETCLASTCKAVLELPEE